MNARGAPIAPPHVETLLRFGDGQRLVGTLAVPRRDAADADVDRPVLLLFNAGVLPRIGPHRLNVKIARRFAGAGWRVLRFDLSGQGDSVASGGTLGFERQSIVDLREAMDALQARLGARRFVTFGICSGAVLGYATALEDPRLVGCAMLDPYMYPTWRTHLNRIRAVIRRDGAGPVLLGVVRRALRRASTTLEAGAAPVDLGLEDLPRETFAAGLRTLVDRGVAVLSLYSASALYHHNYPGQFDDVFSRFGLAGRVATDHLPGVDHTVTTIDAQRELIERLLRWADEHLPR